MKILMTTPHVGLHTGSSVKMGQLAKEMVRRGHDVTALFKVSDLPGRTLDPTIEPLIKAGVKVDAYNFRKLKHADTISEILRLRRFLKERNFDVIHCFKGMDFDFVYLASWGIHVPALLVMRGNGAPLDIFNSIKYRSRRVTAIIAVCEELKNVVVKTGHVAPEKVAVVYKWMNLDRFDGSIDGGPTRDELSIPRSAPVVGIVGSIDFRPGKLKGGHEFARAARIVLDQKPETRFLCVGEINREHFKSLGDELGIADRFVFTGFRTDVPRLIATMDVSVCASTHGEGLTGAIIESLAMSVPVITTDVGGNKEIVRDGLTGYVVPVKEPPALAEGILKIINSPETGKSMGTAGRKLVEELCDFKKQIDKLEAIYREPLQKQL